MKSVLALCGVVAWVLFGSGRLSAQDAQIAAPVCVAEDNNSHVLTCDHQVPHISTVPANKGDSLHPVHLFVRERVASNRAPGKAVLMIHGLSVPVLPGFELRKDHYDWALWLAQAGGFDVFMLDFQGSGLSPLPDRNIDVMKDPCNVPLAQQSILIPNPLSATCPPSYPFQLINSRSDWDELDTVVDYIRNLRGVDKVALLSWSQGSARVGPYAVQHPDKVESLFLYAPIFNPAAPSGTGADGFGPPAALPRPGTPMSLRTRGDLMGLWDPEVEAEMIQGGCEAPVEDGIQDVVWSAIMDNDSLGRSWGPPSAGSSASSVPEGVMRVRTPFLWGWNASTAHKISVPVLIIAGEYDTGGGGIQDLPRLYAEVPHDQKLWFKVQCAGHFMVWERQHRVLHHISKEWLMHGAVEGFTNGSFFVDTEGVIHPQ
jgi:pimeloyl-ACP methyl ester carboxylesterase